MTLLQNLINAGLPVVSATEGGHITCQPGVKITLEQTQQINDIVLEYIDPGKYVVTKRIQNRKLAAKSNAGKVAEIKGLSGNQANTWLKNAVHGSDTETSLNASIDSATTTAELKPILKKITHALYAQTKTNQTMLDLLIALRDESMPDL